MIIFAYLDENEDTMILFFSRYLIMILLEESYFQRYYLRPEKRNCNASDNNMR